ncbi:MAG TPA: MATE family efflux transporter [Polyangia bacterium]|nr:MATE family efflux transporter [Polyangia bacterium]
MKGVNTRPRGFTSQLGGGGVRRRRERRSRRPSARAWAERPTASRRNAGIFVVRAHFLRRVVDLAVGASSSGQEDTKMTTETATVSAAEVVATTRRRDGLIALVREALAGTRHDFTKLPVRRAILLLAIPMVAEMLMESLFSLADIFWVSKLGAAATATVVLTESMLIIVYSFAMGLSMGGAAIVARRIGEKDPSGAAGATVQAIALGLALAVIVGLVGAFAGHHLLRAMGASPEVVALGGRFARVMLGGSITVILLFMINAAFRGAGDPAIAMRTLWLANGINMVLGPVLVFGLGPIPALGVSGAAIATTIGRGIGVIYQIRALRAGRGHLAIRREHLRIDRAVQATILRLSGTGIFQILIATTSWVGLTMVVTSFGSLAVAGYGIATRIVMFALMPSFGMANAAATLVGQNLGAGQPERAEQAVWRASFYNLLFLGTVGLLFVVFGEVIVGAFNQDPVIVGYSTKALRIISAGFLFYAFGMVVTQSFNGAGDTRTPTLINFFCFWLLEIPVAWLLSKPLGLGPTGVFISVLVGFSTMAIVASLLFRRGRWKRAAV